MANLDDSFNMPAAPAQVRPTLDDVIAHLKFGPPREVVTKLGPRITRDAKPSPELMGLWQEDPQPLRAQGYTLSQWPKDTGPWKVTKWEKVPEKIIIERQQSKELSRATDANINIPCPDGLAFFGYQKAGVAFAYGRPSTLIADEPGLGKTCQAIGVVNCLPETKRILVICPASLKENWRREIVRWQTVQRAVFVADSKMLPDMLGWVIVNYDVLYKHEDVLHRIEYDVLIADEIHYCKNKDSRRAKMVFGIKPTKKQRDAGVPEVPGIKAKKKLLLTGTPICNRPAELFPLINYLDSVTWPDFFKYAMRYCDANRDGGHWNFSGASNLHELQSKLRETLMVRRLKKDVLKDLPPKLRRVVEFTASGEMISAVAREKAMYANEEEYNRAVRQLMESGAHGQDRATFRKDSAVAKAKMPDVLAYLDDAVEESGKVIIFIWHHEVARLLKEHFGAKMALIMGDTPLPARQEAVDRFQRDASLPVIVGGIKPMGVGLTLTAASRVIFMELDDVPGNVTQAEDRAHRIGQQDNVLVEHLIVTGTLDAVMARNCVAKQEIIERALDKQKKPKTALISEDKDVQL